MNAQFLGGNASNADVQHGNNLKDKQVDENQKPTSTKEPKKKKPWALFHLKRNENSSESIRDSLDPQESNMDTTDVKQVWFAGCHSGMLNF